MEGQQRLYRLAVEAIALTAWWEPGRGWQVALRLRRGDESWSDSERADYSVLSSPELVDVIGAELARVLGL